jgi:hypothetical protein
MVINAGAIRLKPDSGVLPSIVGAEEMKKDYHVLSNLWIVLYCVRHKVKVVNIED